MSPSRSDYIFTTLGEWVWRVVSEDSFNNRPNRTFSLLTTHVHLVSLFNDLDHTMGLVMFLAIHRHHDFTKELKVTLLTGCLLYTSPSPRDRQKSRMPSSA